MPIKSSKTTKPTSSRRQFLNDPHVLVLLPNIHVMSYDDGSVTLLRPDGEAMRCDWKKLECALVKFYEKNF